MNVDLNNHNSYGGKMTDTELLNWLEKQDGGALINDDFNHWAFASEGMQNINMEDDKEYDLQSTWWVEKHAFKKTIREALEMAFNKSMQESKES